MALHKEGCERVADVQKQLCTRSTPPTVQLLVGGDSTTPVVRARKFGLQHLANAAPFEHPVHAPARPLAPLCLPLCPLLRRSCPRR